MTIPNLFAAYDQPENRVTSALMQTLVNDPVLARRFIHEFVGKRCGTGAVDGSIQARPVELDPYIRKESNPDAWIGTADFMVAIECKIASRAVHHGQLVKHLRQVPAPGALLVLSPDYSEPPSITRLRKANLRPEIEVRWAPWAKVHLWARGARPGRKRHSLSSFLVENLWSYLEMKDLTGFAGVDLADRYEYPRAKAILRALALAVGPRVSSTYPGLKVPSSRHPIKDYVEWRSGAHLVWLPLSERDDFTSVPHFTLSLRQPFSTVDLTIPNGASKAWRKLRTLATNDPQRLTDKLRQLEAKVADGRVQETSMRVRTYQRHFLSQGSPGIDDGEIALAAANISGVERANGTRPNPAWWDAFLELVRQRSTKANWELQVIVDFPNRDPVVQSSSFVDEVVRVMRAFKPLWTLVRA